MNTKKQRQSRICECGAPFKTSVKFGNETSCNTCYAEHSRKFNAWLERQPDEVLEKIMEYLQQYMVELDAKAAENTEKQEQDRIDAIAATLLAELDI